MNQKLLDSFKSVLSHSQVLLSRAKQRPYTQGMLVSDDSEQLLAVLLPDSLVQLWQVLQLCANEDVIIIAQAANTGLTGGSTPYGDYDRPVIIISMQRLHGLYLINDGTEVIALPASTLQQLEQLLEPIDREPHSVLGSSCVGASIIGGVCNNSGGALIHRGPAYTEMSLFARRNQSGEFELINHLGIDLGEDAQTILENLDNARLDDSYPTPPKNGCNSNQDYQTRIRQIDQNTPARYNNDPSGLYEASGSAGRVIVFAVRLATFAKPKKEQVYYISTDNTETLTQLRQQMLSSDVPLPVIAEYMHRDYNQIALKYGKDTCFFMQKLSASRIARMYHMRRKVAYYLDKLHLPQYLPDRVLQFLSFFMPSALPSALRSQATEYRYHLTIKVADFHSQLGIDAFESWLNQFLQQHDGVYQRCSQQHGEQLLTFRFAATAAMFRYHSLHHKQYGELISTDIALPRNANDWDEQLTPELKSQVKTTFYLGHFFCYVFHQDYLLYPNVDAEQAKAQLLTFYDNKGIEYPAEHNVGHIYQAKTDLAGFYKELDPTNSLNPGVGKTCKQKNWQQVL